MKPVMIEVKMNDLELILKALFKFLYNKTKKISSRFIIITMSNLLHPTLNSEITEERERRRGKEKVIRIFVRQIQIKI